MTDHEWTASIINNRIASAGGMSESELCEFWQKAKMPNYAATLADARQLAKQLVGQPLTNNGTGMIASISNNTIGKMTSASAVKKSAQPSAHALALGNLRTLFQCADLGETHSDRDNNSNIRAVHRFYAPMIAGSEVYGVKLTVKEYVQSNQGNRIYTVEALNIAKPARKWVDADIGDRPTSTPHAGFDDKLSQLRDIVNRENEQLPHIPNAETRAALTASLRNEGVQKFSNLEEM